METRHFNIFSLTSIATLLFLGSCSPSQPTFKKEPIDNLIRDYTEYSQYSISLYDMDYNEETKQYLHQYRILYTVNPEESLNETTTEWLPVSPSYFNKHIDDMGMDLVSKTNGQVEKKVTPPGYSQYVGNEQYGQWRQNSDGSSFWEFYGKYAFISGMFNMMRGPIYYRDYYDYRRNYAPYGRTYYGGSGANQRYGTNGSYAKSSNKSWNKKSTSFKQSVRSNVSRSSSRTSRTNSRARTSRTTSRYRTNSSYRSRSGGYGK